MLGDEPLVWLAANKCKSHHSDFKLPQGSKTIQPITGFDVIAELLNWWDKGKPKSDTIQNISRLFLVERCTVCTQADAEAKY